LQNFCWAFVHGDVNRLFLLLKAAFQELHASRGLARPGVAGYEIGTAGQKTSL
jgi:hypothetical protein